MNDVFIDACRNVWGAIADEITLAYNSDTVELDIAVESVLDLGCFDCYCRLSADHLAIWNALSFDARTRICEDALRGRC